MSHSSGAHIALGLGANLNNRAAQLKEAITQLQKKGLQLDRCSTFLDTEPVDCVAGTPPFLNAAVIGKWFGTVRDLFKTCKDIETAMGRPENHSSRAARVIDIDILLFGRQIINEADLQVPHPRLLERLFILQPMHEIASNWRIPPTGITVREAYQQLQRRQSGH